tara:strand:+ start:158 stop:982 length:825 start_codon:yes stop_codon:yes gene_type:complete
MAAMTIRTIPTDGGNVLALIPSEKEGQDRFLWLSSSLSVLGEARDSDWDWACRDWGESAQDEEIGFYDFPNTIIMKRPGGSLQTSAQPWIRDVQKLLHDNGFAIVEHENEVGTPDKVAVFPSGFDSMKEGTTNAFLDTDTRQEEFFVLSPIPTSLVGKTDPGRRFWRLTDIRFHAQAPYDFLWTWMSTGGGGVASTASLVSEHLVDPISGSPFVGYGNGTAGSELGWGGKSLWRGNTEELISSTFIGPDGPMTKPAADALRAQLRERIRPFQVA